MDIKELAISSIEVNDYNPNLVPAKVMEALKKALEREGFLQPVIVRVDPRNPERYIVIDGEHRFTAARDLKKHDTIPCIVLDKTESEAKVLTIAMNRFRGQFDSIKLAELIVDLRQRYSDAELEEFMGFTGTELKHYSEILDIDTSLLHEDDGAAMAELSKMEEEAGNPLSGLRESFMVKLKTPVYEELMDILNQRNSDTAEALTSICAEYLENKKDVAHEEALV